MWRNRRSKTKERIWIHSFLNQSFKDPESVEKAVNDMNGFELEGEKLVVEKSGRN